MKVKFNDLEKLHLPIMDEIQTEINRVIQRGDFINGEALQEFETNWAKFTGKKYCVGVSSGYHALNLSGRALGLEHVVVPTNSFIATATAFKSVYFSDIDPETHLIDIPKFYENNLSIVPVHLYGRAASKEIKEFKKVSNLPIIEDACQAHGNPRVGDGDIQCYSFYPGKNLGCFGDGGAITTNNKDIADKIRLLANYGATKKYHHEIKGDNCRLDTIQAAILNVKIPYLNVWNRARRFVATDYHEQLENLEEIKILPYDKDSVYHLFVIEATLRDRLAKFLNESGIETGLHYPVPIHKQPAYQEYNNIVRPVAEEKAKKILSLPMHPYIKSEEVKYVCDKIKNFYF